MWIVILFNFVLFFYYIFVLLLFFVVVYYYLFIYFLFWLDFCLCGLVKKNIFYFISVFFLKLTWQRQKDSRLKCVGNERFELVDSC